MVSCQPVVGGPMDDDDTVCRLARAALAGGAAGLRIEGARRVARVRAQTDAPVIGLVKRDLPDSPVRITPWLEDIAALARAGAHIIAVDATRRVRPASLPDQLQAIHAAGALAMADCADETDALAAHALGFDLLGSTLSGYTGEAVPALPDIELVQRLSRRGLRVMAEGRYHRPDQVRTAFAVGAFAVTVGTAITRTELITGWFVQAAAHPPQIGVNPGQ